jgi:hypothetical protein
MNTIIKAAIAAVACISAPVSANEPLDLSWQPSKWNLEPARVTYGHYATNGVDPIARELRQIDLFYKLQEQSPGLQSLSGIRIAPTEQDLIDIGQKDGQASEYLREERRYVVGVNQAVNMRVSFSQASLRAAKGQAMAHQNGQLSKRGNSFIWAAPARSEDATAMRVFFSDVDLDEGAELYVYNELGQAYGPYTSKGPFGDGEFWSDTMAGSNLSIQLAGSESAMANSQFTIAELAHIGPRFKAAAGLVPEPFLDQNATGCTGATCVVDGSCADNSDWSNIDMARDSVAQILFGSGPWQYICSGGLIADDDDSTDERLFLTANHCISRAKVANSMETFFHFRTQSCGDCDNSPSVKGPSGATILATSGTSDYTLMQLSGPLPFGTYFAGTSDEDVDTSNGEALYRISHPAGAPQSYSKHTVDTRRGTCGGWPRGDWIYSADEVGGTQGGSSGSPVFNSAGEVVGQLSGGCGTNINDDCDAAANATVDGALAAYYNDIAAYLSPGPGSCVPQTEVCDGLDNNCNSKVDEGNVCGGGEGLPDDTSCKRDSQCASGSCTGRGKNKVCT